MRVFRLGCLYLKTLLYEWIAQKKVEKRLWSHASFRKRDEALLASYKGISPYHVSRDFLKKRGESNLYTYGETPLTTLAELAERFALSPEDHLIELGAGRGRGALFFASYVGCRVTAFEQIPFFAQQLKAVAPPHLTVHSTNFFAADLGEATAIYLYGTLLTDEEITQLIPRFPPAAHIFTVSFPLSAYSDVYQTTKQFRGSFPWGRTEIYCNERIG